ncbi:hypothetical protein CGCS363_v005204 [Colletotrichum siamense]|uniref:uncharacterized protein n=1 Tax=Colletotrichum siamense TaxID=690259 RepID=UPI00187234F9|nr:uncharacterized protein CGCS363_v005204 [Colletotrichum siamense]KAF5506510.1 hypothetical protein CGCS363_v005204 [Colletotrichum siamense]
MRLIDVKTLELKEFFDDNVPRYAILSHTWGQEEPSYLELINGGKKKQPPYVVGRGSRRSSKARVWRKKSDCGICGLILAASTSRVVPNSRKL